MARVHPEGLPGHARRAVVPGAKAVARPGRFGEYLLNDSGNADRLIRSHGTDLLYCKEHGAFIVWDGTRWNKDELRVERLAEDVLRRALGDVRKIPDSDERKKYFCFLNRSLHRAGIANMVQSARRKAVEVSVSDLDSDPLLLNCLNGTVDLRTGQIRVHSRDDRITKLIPIVYDPAAGCPLFMQFLGRIMGAHPDASEGELERAERLVSYLQRCLGCAATALPEKALFILYGRGNNGKTTLLEIVREALGPGEYAGEIQIDTLMMKPRESGASNTANADLADLRGYRFVTSSEVEQGQRLSTARVKYLTGQSQVRARRLYENPICFKPTHKLFMDCNHRPVIQDPHDAIWNRVKCIPFEATIPKEEIDPNLPVKLRAELPGIIRFIVEGAQQYLSRGLQDPAEVQASTEEYRQESDRAGEFFEDLCTFHEDVWCPVTDLWRRYLAWSVEVGEKYPLSKPVFEDRLGRMGCRKAHDPSGRFRAWRGVSLKAGSDGLTTPDRNPGRDDR